MSKYAITFGIALTTELGDLAELDKKRRIQAVYKGVFSLGAAWHGNQSTIFLITNLTVEDVSEKLAPLFGVYDLLMVFEVGSQAIHCIGYLADEDGFDFIFPDATKYGISPSDGTYPLQ